MGAPTVESQLKALMLAGLAGDAVSYRRLLHVVQAQLRSYFRRRIGSDDAALEDLVQETLIAIHTRRGTYDPDRPLTAWLHAIARYKLIDVLRDRRSRPFVPLDDETDFSAIDDSNATTARLDIARLLETVPTRTRELIRAVKIEGRSVAEVSASSGLSESAVKVAIHRGLSRMAARLKRLGGL
jgi:RNA polymerase sigma-70 factor (ECF subfamily)